jgi:hypothetical protein
MKNDFGKDERKNLFFKTLAYVKKNTVPQNFEYFVTGFIGVCGVLFRVLYGLKHCFSIL